MSFKFRILLMCGVYFSFKRADTFMNDILSPSSSYLCNILSFLSACGFFFFLSHQELLAFPATPLPPPPPATTYAICLCVKSFDTVLMSPQTVVEKWCQTFHHQVGLPACSVELKRVSVHFKWPCWSPRCLVKPVKMACPPSPGSCRCRKSIPRLGCNLPNRVEPRTSGPSVQSQ